MEDFEIHPAALIMPEMDDAAFAALKEDVRLNGQQEAVVLYGGKILDGRHRHRACRELGWTTKTRAWVGEDPVAYVLSTNLHRRHLDESQRGMIAAKVANMKREDTLKKGPDSPNVPSGVSQQQAADMLNVSTGTLKRAKAVQDKGTPELVKAVEKGEVSVAAAAKIAQLPAARQGQALAAKKAPRLRRKPAAKDPRRGKHFASEGEVVDALKDVTAMLSRWEAIGGLKKLVGEWERAKRWQLCDQLEKLGRILRSHATDLRHHTKET